jgi:hypothetical protein
MMRMEDQAIWKIETTKPYEKVMVSQYVYSREYRDHVIQERGEALFHGFGLNSMEGEVASVSVVIVEWPDGSLELIPVSPLIRFIEPHKGG